MPANISYINGRAEFAYVGESPWWGIGNGALAALQTGEAIITKAGMLWTVSTRPFAFQSSEDSEFDIVAKKFRVIVRDDINVPFAPCTSIYQPFQNIQAAQLVDEIMKYGACCEVGGALGNGEKCWILVRLPQEGEVVRGDQVKQYFLLTWSHDGSLRVSGRNTTVRVVCENTWNAAMADAVAFGYKHTKGGLAEFNVDEIRTKLDLIVNQGDKSLDLYRQMAATSLTVEQTENYIADVFPYPKEVREREEEGRRLVAELLGTSGRDLADALDAKKANVDETRDVVATLLESGKGADIPGVRGTVWGAYNAVTEYVDHVYPVTQSGQVSKTRQQSVLFSSYKDLKDRALDAALALTK